MFTWALLNILNIHFFDLNIYKMVGLHTIFPSNTDQHLKCGFINQDYYRTQQIDGYKQYVHIEVSWSSEKNQLQTTLHNWSRWLVITKINSLIPNKNGMIRRGKKEKGNSRLIGHLTLQKTSIKKLKGWTSSISRDQNPLTYNKQNYLNYQIFTTILTYNLEKVEFSAASK